MPLSSTVRLAALLATLVRSDISLSVGDAGIELSSNTSRNLSKDNSTGTDQTPGSTEHFEGPDKDFIIVENRLNIKCYQKKENAPSGGSFVEMSRASDRKNKISRSGEGEGEGEGEDEEYDDEESQNAGLSGDEDSHREPDAIDPNAGIVANPDADDAELNADDHGDQEEEAGREIVPAAAQDDGAGGGGGLVKSKKLPLERDQGECPGHEATQDEDKVKCDALTPLVLIEEGEKEGQPLLYEVNCQENKAKVEELIVLANQRIQEAKDAIEAVKAEEEKLNKLIDAEQKKAEGSVAALEAVKAALGQLSPEGITAFVAGIATDKIFQPPPPAA